MAIGASILVVTIVSNVEAIVESGVSLTADHRHGSG